MEIFLNLVWAILALAGVVYWLCIERRKGVEQLSPLIALTMTALILFPVISVSDDLWSIQNPAETDTTQRRIHVVSSTNSSFSAFVALPEVSPVQLRFEFIQTEIPRVGWVRKFTPPMPFASGNRPPPAC